MNNFSDKTQNPFDFAKLVAPFIKNPEKYCKAKGTLQSLTINILLAAIFVEHLEQHLNVALHLFNHKLNDLIFECMGDIEKMLMKDKQSVFPDCW